MKTTVSARIPLPRKNAAHSILEGIGASQSDLIHAAYEYVIAHGCLPDSESHIMRVASAHQRSELLWLYEHTRVSEEEAAKAANSDDRTAWPSAWFARNLVVQCQRRRYEALA